jgi:alpha-methylacyl-CoA racemase
VPPSSPSPSPGFLSGVTILDLSTVGPAARSTRLLADYGATVVKVGTVAGSGADPIRPPYYAYSAARSLDHVAIDLKDPDGRDAFLALVATADVVVESFRPGVMDRLGIGFAALSEANPSIILCSTTGYGQSGSRAAWAGHDLNYLAVGGYLATTEPRSDGGPPVPGATIADAAGGGMQAALSIVAALCGRSTQTEPSAVHLDVSIAEGVLWLTSLAVDEHLATGAPVGPGQSLLTGRYACYDCYRAADGGWVAVAAIEPKFFANLCRALDCEQWIAHQLDDDAQDKIRADFAAAFVTKDRDTWVAELAPADTCVSAVQTVGEVSADPALVERGTFTEVVAPPGAGDEVPDRFTQVTPLLAGMVRPTSPVTAGDPSRTDTDRLLTAAGLDPQQVAALRERGVVA